MPTHADRVPRPARYNSPGGPSAFHDRLLAVAALVRFPRDQRLDSHAGPVPGNASRRPGLGRDGRGRNRHPAPREQDQVRSDGHAGHALRGSAVDLVLADVARRATEKAPPLPRVWVRSPGHAGKVSRVRAADASKVMSRPSWPSGGCCSWQPWWCECGAAESRHSIHPADESICSGKMIFLRRAPHTTIRHRSFGDRRCPHSSDIRTRRPHSMHVRQSKHIRSPKSVICCCCCMSYDIA